MKKFIAIALLSIYLMTATELRELLKFPVLIEHFAEHKSKNRSITLWKFLCLHYADGIAHDAEHDKNMKLPFKSNSCFNSCTALVFLIVEGNYISPVIKFTEERKPAINFYTSLVSSSYLKAIWQPPQIC